MTLQRPSRINVYRWLAGRKAVIAHFSSVAKGEAEGLAFNPEAYYPSDLKRVIEGRIEGSLPCSVIIPSDELDLRSHGARATGSIGVALGLKDELSLVGAYPHDNGTQWNGSGPRKCPPQPILTISDLEKTITDRPDDEYNEWCIQDYEVLGLFVTPPFLAWRAGAQDASPENLKKLRADFGDLSIYTFDRAKRLIMRFEHGTLVPAEHEQLYSVPGVTMRPVEPERSLEKVKETMYELTVTISTRDRGITREHELRFPGEQTREAPLLSRYLMDILRIQEKRFDYLEEFKSPQQLSNSTFSRTVSSDWWRAKNIWELCSEIDNLFHAAGFSFASARATWDLESEYSADDRVERNFRWGLHQEKMSRFDFGVSELSRLEDLLCRAIYEFFGTGFCADVDETISGWEKRITWDRVKRALNRRVNADAHPKLAAMSSSDYETLVNAVRGYKSAAVMRLKTYRDRRTHQTAPIVDYPQLGRNVESPVAGRPFSIPIGSEERLDFGELFSAARTAFSDSVRIATVIAFIIHPPQSERADD